MYKYSWQKGKAAEALFKRLMRENSYVLVRASDAEDKRDHIDFHMTGYKLFGKNTISVDVKGDKKASRSKGEILVDKIVVEYVGVEGKTGVIEGKEDTIAFKVGSKFILTHREALKKLCYKIAPPNSQTTSNYNEALEKTMLYKRAADKSMSKSSIHRGIMLFIDVSKIDNAILEEYDIPLHLLEWYDKTCEQVDKEINMSDAIRAFEYYDSSRENIIESAMSGDEDEEE